MLGNLKLSHNTHALFCYFIFKTFFFFFLSLCVSDWIVWGGRGVAVSSNSLIFSPEVI